MRRRGFFGTVAAAVAGLFGLRSRPKQEPDIGRREQRSYTVWERQSGKWHVVNLPVLYPSVLTQAEQRAILEAAEHAVLHHPMTAVDCITAIQLQAVKRDIAVKRAEVSRAYENQEHGCRPTAT